MARRAVGSAGLLLLPAGCLPRDGLLAPAGGVASRQSQHMVEILLWMVPVILPIFVALPLILWRHRLRGPGRYMPDWEFSWPLEAAIWGVPAVVVTILGWNLWTETRQMDPYAPLGTDPVEIGAVAYDWKWLFLYPDGPATADLLVLPEEAAARLRMTSATVLQSFAVPRIGGQIYAMPGMATEFNLATGAPGRFEGRNMQYNGTGFPRQNFEMRVLSRAAYDAWLAEARDAPALDAAALEELARAAPLAAPQVWGRVEGDPFAAAMARGHGGHGGGQ